MNIKYVLAALVVILFICNLFCIYEMQNSMHIDSNSSSWAMIGDKLIKLPENYSASTELNQICISDGSDLVYVYKINKTNVDSAIKDYEKAYSDNFTVVIKEFDSKVPSKKTDALVNSNSTITKYWFELDNAVYQIQVNNNDAKYDGIVRDMINSMS